MPTAWKDKSTGAIIYHRSPQEKGIAEAQKHAGHGDEILEAILKALPLAQAEKVLKELEKSSHRCVKKFCKKLRDGG